MNENIPNLLKDYGLDKNEIKIFIFLVGKGELSAYRIAKETKIHRSTAYDILERLIEKGFVSQSGLKKKLYSTNEISKVLGRLKRKEVILNELIPEIQMIESEEDAYVKQVNTTGSYSEINNKIFQLAKQKKLTFIYMIGNGPNINTKSSIILVEKLLKDISKSKLIKNIDIRTLWDKKFKEDKFMKLFEKLGENRFLEHIPTKVTTIIFDNHVAFLYFTNNDNFIEIKNKQISDEFKVYFEYLWKLGK